MFAFHLTSPALNALERVTLDTPSPGRGEVLVRLRAASLNYIDVVVANGGFPVPSFPWIPVSDGAGEVAEVGAEVTEWRVGDRVVPHFLPDWRDGALPPVEGRRMRGINMPGSLAEYVVVPTSGLTRLPDAFSFEQGASLPIAATTAWSAIKAGRLAQGSTVLVMGTGGVSLFSLQFAKAAGARVIVISSSDEKLDRARALGADEGINYRAVPDWDGRMLELTNGRGVDLVVETGGAETFARSLNTVALEGTIVSVGFLTGDTLTFPIWPLNLKKLHILGSNTGSVADLNAAIQTLHTFGIEPVIDSIVPFDEAGRALASLSGNTHFGKIVVTI